MNFFSHQDRARSNTRKLVFLFLCAVVTLIVITSFLVIGILFYAETQGGDLGLNRAFLTSKIFLEVSLAVIAVVVFGSLYRMSQLRGGGKTVAEAMNGRLLNINTRDADERKILNVVEEMAIASGIPVPPVYLMEDQAINAFAAGYQPQDAVIGITRGCIQQLSRDELQGVIGHEFSHIFNGDMRLNIRLIGLLYGIMVIGIIGYFMLRGGGYGAYRVRSGSGRGKGNAILLLGVGLLIVGYGGTFFGNLIKAAVSRQREFLADASAVQFTRNPLGIGGALKKIGGYKGGTRITSTDASEISHMLFCEGLKRGFTGLFATHPPLDERIRRIDPQWKGQAGYKSDEPGAMESGLGASHFASAQAQETAVDAIGNPGSEHLVQAAVTLEGIPAAIREEAHGSMGAVLIIYSLLVSLSDAETTSKQKDMLQASLNDSAFRAVGSMLEIVQSLSRTQYLPLVDLSLPSLKQLSSEQYRQFMSLMGQLIMADSEISLFEWSLFKILRYNLDERPGRRKRAIGITALAKECEVLLSVLAASGQDHDGEAAAAFDKAENFLGLSDDLVYRPEYRNDTEALERAVDRLNQLKPLEKPLLLKAMVTCINADGVVTAEESELLRAVGSLLDCPIPPLLPGQRFI